MADRVFGGWTITEDRGTDALGTVHLVKGPGGQTGLLRVLHERHHTPAAAAILRETLTRAQLLAHPNVLAVRAFADGREGPAWIVEEDIGGVTLASLLDMNVKLLWTSAAMVLHEVTAAVSYAIRQGVIHGGLSAGSVLLAQDGRVKVRGFGLSRLTDGSLDKGEARLVTPREDLRAIGRLAHDLVVGASFGQKDSEQLEQDVEGLGLPEGYREILRVASRTAHAELQSTQQVLAHLRTLLQSAGLDDVGSGLRHTFEELSFFFLVAGGAPREAALAMPSLQATPGAPRETVSNLAPDPDGEARTVVLQRSAPLNDLLDEPVAVDAPTVVGVAPKREPDAPLDPAVWLGGDQGDSPDADELPVTEEMVPALTDTPARRAVGAEFERVADGTSRLVWVVVGLLIVALVAIGVVVTTSVMSNAEATREAVIAEPEEELPNEPAPPPAEPVRPPAAGLEPSPAPVVPKPRPAPPEPPTRDAIALRAEKEAAALMEAGKPVAAREILETARAKVPGDALLALGVARTMIATGSWADARRVLEDAVRLDRGLADAYVLLGHVQMQAGDAAGAVDAMRHVLDRKGDDPDFLLALAEALFAKGEHDGALPILLRAIELRRDFPAASLVLGRTYERLRDPAKAIEAYKAAAADRGLAEEALLRIVDLMEKRGQLKQALALLQERLVADPDFAILYLVLGDVHYREHRFADARKHLERYLELVPGAADAKVALGNVLYHLRDPRGAEVLYRGALELAPTDSRAAHNLGMMQLAQGDVAGAQETFGAAIGGDYALWQTRCELGRVRHRAGRLAEARELYKAALGKKPDHPWLGKMVALPMDSGQAEILMSRPCDDREIVTVSLERPTR